MGLSVIFGRLGVEELRASCLYGIDYLLSAVSATSEMSRSWPLFYAVIL